MSKCLGWRLSRGFLFSEKNPALGWVRKLGSMVRINGLVHLPINEVYWGYPNFNGTSKQRLDFFSKTSGSTNRSAKVPGKPKHSMYGEFTWHVAIFCMVHVYVNITNITYHVGEEFLLVWLRGQSSGRPFSKQKKGRVKYEMHHIPNAIQKQRFAGVNFFKRKPTTNPRWQVF